MKWLFYGLCAFLTLPLRAGVMDVSSQESALVSGGGTLTYNLFTWNYGQNAQALGLPLSPTDLSFTLISAPGTIGEFSATLLSADASIEIALEGSNLDFTPGYLACVGFQGAVSTLQGHFHFASAVSQDLFGGGSVSLILKNTAGDVSVGLAPLTLQHDLFVSLSGGPLSVGAMSGGVALENPEPTLPAGLIFRPAVVSPVPEPGSGLLIFCGGALVLTLSTVLNRVARSRR